MSRERPLTVLHIDTERGWRGGQRQTLWLAAALDALGHTSIVAARRGDALETRARSAGVRTIGVRPRSELAVLTAHRLRRVVRARGVQVVHAHTGHAVSLAALASRGTSAVVIVTRRVNVPLRRNLGTRWKYARARRILAVSAAIAETLRRGGMAEERLAVVPDGVDLSRIVSPASAETLARLGVPEGVPWVLQAGALDVGKDPVTFVRAIALVRRAVPAVHGVLAGTGKAEPAVRAEIARLGLEHVVHLAGHREDADALIAAASVATLTSVEEGLGTVLLDAMALGTPVVATRAGGIPEIVRHEDTGLLVSPRDAEAVGAALARVLTEPGLARRLTTNARGFVTELSVERMAERTAAEYYRALDGA